MGGGQRPSKQPIRHPEVMSSVQEAYSADGLRTESDLAHRGSTAIVRRSVSRRVRSCPTQEAGRLKQLMTSTLHPQNIPKQSVFRACFPANIPSSPHHTHTHTHRHPARTLSKTRTASTNWRSQGWSVEGGRRSSTVWKAIQSNSPIHTKIPQETRWREDCRKQEGTRVKRG